MTYLHTFGKYVPQRVVGNAEIAARVGKTPEWIENASGIRERRWAEAGESVADMGVAAAQDCLARAGVEAGSIGMLLVASGSASRGFPGPAAEIAQRLGMGIAPALDLPLASAGSVFGLALAMQLAAAQGDVLVVAAEKMSEVIDSHPLDANTAVLFGDGAGAALVSVRQGRWKLLDAVLHTDGQYQADLRYDVTSPLAMNGLAVILQASRKLPSVIQEVLERQGLNASQVGTFLVHQANLNLLTRVGKTLGVPADRVFVNVVRYGNTSSASVLLAAAEWAEAGAEEGPVVFAAFGAGFHWGAIIAV